MAILFQNILDTNIMVKLLTNIITEEILLNKYVNSWTSLIPLGGTEVWRAGFWDLISVSHKQKNMF
jgi:hypothetical protein